MEKNQRNGEVLRKTHKNEFVIFRTMYFNLLIITVILVAVIMVTLGIKMLFERDAEFSAHSCALEDGSLDKDEACSKCQLKELADCPEIKDYKLRIK